MSDREDGAGTGLMEGEGKVRVFFALWPSTALALRLAQARDELHAWLAGRPMKTDTLHMTLLFIGDTMERSLPGLANMAGELKVEAFVVTLDQAACWRHNRIGHLAAQNTPAPLRNLVQQLEQGLERMGIKYDRRPYHPHVTLIRNADCKNGNPALEPITWAARDFVLVSSTLRANGARYEELGRWPLLG